MRRFRIQLLLVMMFICSFNYAQDVGRGWILKYDIVSLLGDQVTNSMGIMLGIEHFLNEKRSVAIDAMYIFPCSGCGKTYSSIPTDKTNGFSVSGEYRFYIIPGRQPATGFHLGPQVYYQYTVADLPETYDGGKENIYQVYRSLLATHVMAGYQLPIAGPFVFNPSFGLGFRYISSRNENKQGNDSGQHEFLYNKDYESGSQWFPSFKLNIKIGLKI